MEDKNNLSRNGSRCKLSGYEESQVVHEVKSHRVVNFEQIRRFCDGETKRNVGFCVPHARGEFRQCTGVA